MRYSRTRTNTHGQASNARTDPRSSEERPRPRAARRRPRIKCWLFDDDDGVAFGWVVGWVADEIVYMIYTGTVARQWLRFEGKGIGVWLTRFCMVKSKELTSIVPLPMRAAHNLQILGLFFSERRSLTTLRQTSHKNHQHAYIPQSRVEPPHTSKSFTKSMPPFAPQFIHTYYELSLKAPATSKPHPRKHPHPHILATGATENLAARHIVL